MYESPSELSLLVVFKSCKGLYSLSASANGSISQAFCVRTPDPSPSRIQTARSRPSVTWALAIWKKWPVTRVKSLPGKCLTAPFHQACHAGSAINLSISRDVRQLTPSRETYIIVQAWEGRSSCLEALRWMVLAKPRALIYTCAIHI